MKKKSIWFLTSFLLLFLFLNSSCSRETIQEEDLKKKNISVSFCIDILGVNEPIFTKPLLDILGTLEKRGELTLQIVECQNRSEYEKRLSQCAKTTDLVVAGPMMAEATRETAKLFPDKYFVLFDFYLPGNNIIPVVFEEDKMAKTALDICKNHSKTKKVAAIFPGNPDSPLSIFLNRIWKDGTVDFVPYDASVGSVLMILKRFQDNHIDFVYLAKASYLEDTLLALSKEQNRNMQVVCPRIILSKEQTSVVFCQIEKNFDPILKEILQDYKDGQLTSKNYFVRDFNTILTK